MTWSDGLFDFEENICKFSHDIMTPIIGICEKNYFSLWDICLVNVTGYQKASLGFSHCEIQGFYRAGKFNYFLSNNATVESWMLHQCLT